MNSNLPSFRQFSFAILLAVLVQGVGAQVSLARSAEPVRVATVMSEEAHGVVLHLDAPRVEWTEGSSYLYPKVDGFGTLQDVGKPALPIKIERVAIPPGSTPRLTILSAESSEFRSGVVGPVQTRVPVEPGSLDSVALDEEDPAVYEMEEAYPSASPVRLGTVGFLREQAFVEVIFNPVLYDPSSRRSVTYRSVTVRIDFDGGEAEVGESAIDPDFEGVYGAGLVNAHQGRAYRATGKAPGMAGEETLQTAESTLAPLTSKYKLTVNRDRVYRLDVAWVTTNAPALLTQNPSRYRMDCLGVQIPITVVDANGDGTLNNVGGSDYIEFYGQAMAWDILGADTWNAGDYTDDNVYWLYADSGSVLRIPTRAGNPVSGYPIPADFSETVHSELNNRFQPIVPMNSTDHWYQDPPLVLNPPTINAPLSVGFTVNTPGVSTATATASLKARLLGDNYVNNKHRTSILVNGNTASGPSDWQGWIEYTHGVDSGPANFAQSVMNDGTPDTTTLTVSLPGRDANSDGTANDHEVVYFNWAEITYGRKFAVDTDINGDGTKDQTLTFAVPNQNTQIHMTGFSPSSAAIYEISKTIPGTPLADPVRITGAQIAGSAMDFQFPIDGSFPATRRFIASTLTGTGTTGVLVPASVKVDTASNLHTPVSGVDWLVIAPESVLPVGPGAWQDLLARRASQGLATSVVKLEDVYDEFSYGIADPQAIRDFVTYVYASWPRTSPNVPVRYVILLGDASFDYKNLYAYNPPKNVLSSYMRTVASNPILGWLSDDSYFSTVSGTDALPDVFLGRWPVRNSTDTTAVAQKILNYETQPSGTWQGSVVFVADDGDPSFESVQNDQANWYLTGNAYQAHKTYEGQIAIQNPGMNPSQVATETHDRIQNQLRGTVDVTKDIGPGAVVLSYVGHGDWQHWGSNFTFFQTTTVTDDLDPVSNGGKLPLVLVADCLSGAFGVTSAPGAALDLTLAFGDDFLVKPNKGAIGVLAPVHITFSPAHTTIENTFFLNAFGPRKTRLLGGLLSSIQLAFHDSGDDPSIGSYVLLGDPAVKLAAPAPRAPTNIVATPGNKQVTLSWTTSPDATSYSIYMSTNPGGPYGAPVATGVTGSSKTITGLTNCTPYWFSVVAVNAGFEGPWSNMNDGCNVAGDCLTATPVTPSAPAAPTGVTATDNENGGTILVSWPANPASNEVQNYTVYWGASNGNYPQSANVGLVTSAIVPGLVNGQTYYFAVSATNCSHGEGVKSSPGVPGVPHRIEGIKPPNSIDDLRISKSPDPGDGIADALLQWTPPTTNVYGQPTTLSSQVIYTGTTPNFTVDPSHLLATVSGSANSYVHENGVGDALKHYYLIVAVDTNQLRSGIGQELPQGIDALHVTRSGGNLVFTWPAITLDLDGRKTTVPRYALHGRNTKFHRSDIGPANLIQDNIAGTSVSVPTPATPAGTAFFYSVIAYDIRGAASPW